MTLRAPFPWFGGKSRAAHLVWAAFGDVPNYVEPFAGSLAVLLSRPVPARIETDAGRDPSLYTHDDLDIAAKVRVWAVEHGSNRKLRIAYCSYGEAPPPDGWQRVKWKANGGYAASAGNHANAHRETIDFSPHCLPVEARQRSLFGAEVGA